MNKSMSKAERREAARERARKLAAQEAKKAQRNKLYTIIGILVAIAIVGVAIWAIINNNSGDDAVDFDPPLVTVTETQNDAGVSDGYTVVPEGVTPATDAKDVAIYFDYMCRYCAQLESNYGYQINDMMEKGQINLTLHPVAILNTNFSTQGAAAFHYIAGNSPEHLAKFHKELFDLTSQIFSGQSSTEPGWPQIVDAAKAAGVPAEIADSIEANVDTEWLNGATNSFREKYTGTPTVLMDGQENYQWAEEGFYSMVGVEDPNN